MLIEMCRWPRGHFENNAESRIAILFDDLIGSACMLSVATLPRRPPVDIDRPRSAASRYGELLQLSCQVVTDPSMIS